MPLAPVVAAALTNHAAHHWSLLLDGLDLIPPPGVKGGVLIDSVDLTVAGPGDVSGLSFTVNDPLKAYTVTDGQRVLFWDNELGYPLFLGQVNAWAPKARGLGRVIDVDCVGVEALADWLALPAALTIAAGTAEPAAIQQAYTACTGLGWPLNIANGALCTTAAPISNGEGNVLVYDVELAAGTTFREAHRLISASGEADSLDPHPRALTIDFYGGVRSWTDDYISPGAYTHSTWEEAGCLFVDDRAGMAAGIERVASGLELGYTGAKYRQVVVVGSNAAGSGAVSDGSGIPGPTAITTEPTSNTAAKRDALGRAYLRSSGVTSMRGRYRVEALHPEDVLLGTAGGLIAFLHTQIQDDQTGNTATAALGGLHRVPVTSINKRFNPSGTEEWVVDYGAEVPSVTRLIRQLTRTTKS